MTYSYGWADVSMIGTEETLTASALLGQHRLQTESLQSDCVGG